MGLLNREIRARAWAVYRANWKALAAASLIVFVIQSAMARVLPVLFPESLPQGLVQFTAGILLYPITSIGMARMFLVTWREETARVGEMFWPLGSFRRWCAALLQGMLHFLLSLLIALPLFWVLFMLFGYAYQDYVLARMFDLPYQAISAIVKALVPGAALVCLFLFLVLHLTMFPYAFADDPAMGPAATLKRAWRSMDRGILKLISLYISAGWWICLLMAAVGAACWFALGLSLESAVENVGYFTDSLWLAFLPLLSYLSMVLAGFADGRLKAMRLAEADLPREEAAEEE